MMFGRILIAGRLAQKLAAGTLAGLIATTGAAFAEPVAIVPTQVIYPGQEIDLSLLREVVVTNPNLRDDYIGSLAELEGSVARRTLLPGRVIPTSAVRESYAIERGEVVRLVYSNAGMVISASGSPLAAASVGDLVRVRNVDTGVTVSGTVMADRTVRVLAQ